MKYSGLYVASTSAKLIEKELKYKYSYIRFYENGDVFMEFMSEDSPTILKKQNSADLNYDLKGTFKINGAEISIFLTKIESNGSEHNNPISLKYSGTIAGENKIFLRRYTKNGDPIDFFFDFLPFE